MQTISTVKESFALAGCDIDAREKVIAQTLVFGTEDWYYYRGLVLLQKLSTALSGTVTIRSPTEQENDLLKELKQHLNDYKHCSFNAPRYTELETRFYLLTWFINTDNSKRFVQNSLRLNLPKFQDHGQNNDNNPFPTYQQTLEVPQQQTFDTATKKTYPSCLDTSLLDRDRLIRQHLNNNQLDELNVKAFPLLQTYWPQLTTDQQTKILKGLLLTPVSTQDAVAIPITSYLITLWRPYANSNSSTALAENVMKIPLWNLTLDQLDELQTSMPVLLQVGAFVNAYMEKLVPDAYLQNGGEYVAGTQDWWNEWEDDNVEADGHSTWDSYLMALDGFADKLVDGPFRSVKARITYQKLRSDILRGSFDESLLLAYLFQSQSKVYSFAASTPMPTRSFSSSSSSSSLFGAKAETTSIKIPLLGYCDVSDNERTKVIGQYITGLIRTQKLESWEALGRYLDHRTFLEPLQAKVMLTSGLAKKEDIAGWSKMLGRTTFTNLTNETILTFGPATLHNARNIKLTQDDTIKVHVTIKNIPRLTLRIFPIDLFNYWKLHPHDCTIKDGNKLNVDGLCPIYEHQLDYSNVPPLQLINETFIFGKGGDSNDGKPIASELFLDRGAWMIDFIGGQNQCRAIVQKGYLRHLIQNSAAGHIFFILDENNQPLMDVCSIWFENSSYKADESGNILIPYRSKDVKKVRALLVTKTGYCQPIEFYHQAERYSLHASFYLNYESLVPTKRAKVIITPSIKLQDQVLPLQLLNKLSLQIVTTNTNGIKSSISIINLKSVKGKPLECEFIVPKALASIQLTLKAKVKTMSKEQSWKHLEFTREIHSKSLNQDEITTTQLRANTSGYFVCVVGKNGEPHKRHVLDLSFKHILTHKEIDVTMQTDENGHITLGALDQVESVAIKQLGREWNLLADNWKSIGNQDEVALPSAIHYYANTEFEIPFAMREGCKCTLFKTGHQTITIADYTMRLKYTDSTVIVVGGLPEGSYRFYLSRPHVRHDTLIEVTIVKDNRTRQNPTIERKKGDLWNDWMINNRIYGKISGDVIKQPLGIDNITITDSSLTLKLNNATTTKYPTFAVITTSVFLPPLPDSLYNSQIRNAKNTRPSIKNMNRNGMEHIYLSGRKLGEEYQYILNRAKEDKYVGSTLTEPSLLVNPKKNRSTTIRSRVTGKGNRGFTSETKQKNSTAALLDGGAYGFHHGKNSSSYTQFGFEYLNNRTKALVLQVNDQGEVEIDRSRLGDGNLLQVIILSGDQVIGRTLVLPDVDLTMKLSDQRQTDQDLDVNAPYLRNKLITVLSPSHPQHTMEIDQTQHESEIVDSQEGLFDIFKLLAPHQSKELADFDILRQWGIWNDEEKLKAHDKMNSHELNLWIKYKDTSYFENNIKPFIKDKIDKTFMDDYLIDADLTRYANDLYLFQQLNVAEKALLAKRVPQALPTVLQIFKDNYTRNLSDQPFDTVLAGNSLAIPVPEHSTGFGLKSHFPRPPPPPPPPQASGAFGATQSSESFVSSNTPGTFGSSQSFGGFGSGPQPRPTLQSMPATGFGSAAPQAAISLFAPAVAFGSAAVVQSSAATPPPTVDARNKMDTKSTGADIEGNTFYDEDNAINDEITEVDTVIALRNQAAKRHQSQQPYEYMGRTSEWEEQEYYDTAPGLINVNQFWIDYLENELDVFVSANAIYATSSIAEMIFALALLDLPIKPDVNYDVSSDLATGKIFLSAQTPLIVFYRSLKKYIQPVVPTPTLLLGQHIFERNKNSINSSGEEHIVDPAHLLLQTPYGWHLAISNISTKAVVCEVTLQIPTGAVPLGETPYCQSKNIMIQPYTTWHEVVGSFYFPEQGTFHQFPVTLGKQQNDRPQYNNDIDEINGPSTTNMILLNQTQPLVLTVNEIDEQKQLHESTSTAPLTTYASWSVITSTGTTDDILNFIENHSDKLKDLDWSLVKWRMTNPSFARSLLTLLATRKHYVNSIYAYGIYHGFNDIIADLLVQERFSLLQKTGITFDCHLVKWRAYGNHYQKVLDYYPISNARAHPLGSSHEIANEEFFKHYDTFLTYLNQSVQRTSNDYLILSIYLIIHGRIGEAQQAYTQSQQTSNEDDDGNRATTVQTDYLGAYLATRIKVGDKMDWSTVKKMVAKYKTCGSLRWRNLFAQLNDLVMQAEKSDHQDTGSSGFGMATVNKTSLGTDPVFDFTIKDNQVVVRYANLTEMQVRFYTINVEVMFSNQPFLNKANKMSNYGWVQANHVETINLLDEQPYDKVVMMDNADDDDDFGWIGISKVKQRRHILPIPLVGNLLVEIHAHGKTQCQTHYNHALTVHLSEQNGLARVLSTVSLEHHQQKPLSGVYVKVYAKLDNGCVEFWKDGYTGLTGVFDYISVTHGNALAGPANLEQVVKKVRKFALLFSSETYGAVVKEAGTPV
ncbi:hypothetical protein BCR42DRAFT_413153 [Absidia repens]|uniref:Uncharacterized protein n=1 Tax=Absidia repens TaxID=90262 RepID=A0A1X2IKQ4_9FUNG|nr:hypothetical protein BCR42DRAFT_413153 [Absidia repens]